MKTAEKKLEDAIALHKQIGRIKKEIELFDVLEMKVNNIDATYLHFKPLDDPEFARRLLLKGLEIEKHRFANRLKSEIIRLNNLMGVIE